MYYPHLMVVPSLLLVLMAKKIDLFLGGDASKWSTKALTLRDIFT